MAHADYLFNMHSWNLVDARQRQQLAIEIEKIEPDRLLNTSVEDLAHYFAEKFKIDVPVLDENNLVVDQREKQIDISRDLMRDIIDRSRPFYITGSEIEVEIPFIGEAEAFRIQPNPFTLNPPKATIRGRFLTFAIAGTNLEANRVRSEIDRTVGAIQSYLTNLRANVAGLNSQLFEEARSVIETRRSKLLANRNTVASLGFKMKERLNARKTYIPTEIRKKITPVMPQASLVPYRPEPVLGQTDYEHILGVMQSMTQVMELSPSAFHEVNEEALRSHFLVQPRFSIRE